jgi:hypothetical protein
MSERINLLNKYLKDKFGERTLKICVDGGFTCPNRDGKCGVKGCIFCSERGSGDRLKRIAIKDQVEEMLEYKKERADKFIIYFQNYTNTYDTVENLKKKYDEALISDKIVALAIATRPDEIDEEKAKLIKSYSDKYYTYVELGLQTINDEVAKTINRGYELETFKKAVEILNKYDIDIVVHIMIGLPGETEQDIIDFVNMINSMKISGIKIHSTYIVENTELEKMYKEGTYTPISFEYYIDKVTYIITHLRKDIVVHRFSGDPPKDILVAPEWENHKKKVMNTIINKFEKENLIQGMYYGE